MLSKENSYGVIITNKYDTLVSNTFDKVNNNIFNLALFLFCIG